MGTDLTPMEKMDSIYEIVIANEARRKRDLGYRMVKWLIILGIIFSVFSYPDYIVGKIISYVEPIVMEQMKTMLDHQKESLIQQAKDMLPDASN